MSAVAIDDPDDPRLSAYALLREPRALRRAGLFVAEGRLVVERLLRERGYVLRSLLLNAAAERALAPLLTDLQPAPEVYVCSSALMAEVTGHDFHRGCLGLAERPRVAPADELLAGAELVVVLEGVANPDNIGGVFRNAAAFGADAVLLGPACGDPLYRKAIRTSMGATLCVPFAVLGQPWPAACFQALRALGFELLALTPRAPAFEIDEYAARPGRRRRLALVLGAEGEGLSHEAIALSDRTVRIAIRADVDSLNLAVACGIALQRLASRVPPR